MAEFWQSLAQQWQAQSWVELVAVVLAVAYVWLAAKQNIWCWICALVSTAIYTWLFWEVSLPFQAGLNAYYLLMAVYGWWRWYNPGQEQSLQVSHWSWQRHLKWVAGLGIVAVLLVNLTQDYFSNAYLWLDVLVTVFSVYATYLMAVKVLENWLYWIVIDAMAAYLYLQSGMLMTAVLFVGYLGFAAYGYFSWKQQHNAEPVPEAG